MWTKPKKYGIRECETKEFGINLWETTFNSQV